MFTTPKKAYFDSYSTQIFTTNLKMMYSQKIEKINVLIKNTLRALFVRRGSSGFGTQYGMF